MKNKIKTYIVANDIHIPEHNIKAVSCLFKSIELIKPDGVVLNGDIGNWGTFSRHDRFSTPKCHWTDSDFYNNSGYEYSEVNKFLDVIDNLAPRAEKFFNFGNHEVWVNDWIKESKTTRKEAFSLESRLNLVKRGYEITKYNSFIKLGKLKITHGIYTGANHAKKHVDAMGSSILYGHLHDIQVYSKVTPEAVSHMAWSNGCLCNINPDYLRNAPQNWNHGFAIVYVWPNRSFQVDIVRIQDGKCMVHGKEIIS